MSQQNLSQDLERLSDAALMLRYKDGDIAAFEVLFTRYLGLKKYISFKLNIFDPEVADEVFQETWERIINARQRYEANASFRAYFETILRNVTASRYRKAVNKENLHLSGSQSSTDDSEDELLDGLVDEKDPGTENRSFITQCVDLLKKAIATLPDEQRESLLLKIESGISLEEIAAITGVNRETTKSRLRYGLNKLRDQVPRECYE